MSNTIELVVKISEHQYEICKQALKDFGDRPITECEYAIAVGTPLDDVKAEIDEQYDKIHPYNIYVAEGLEMALDILDNIGKESME